MVGLLVHYKAAPLLVYQVGQARPSPTGRKLEARLLNVRAEYIGRVPERARRLPFLPPAEQRQVPDVSPNPLAEGIALEHLHPTSGRTIPTVRSPSPPHLRPALPLPRDA